MFEKMMRMYYYYYICIFLLLWFSYTTHIDGFSGSITSWKGFCDVEHLRNRNSIQRLVKNRHDNLQMLLVPISRKELKVLIPRHVTNTQWFSYWGNTRINLLQKLLESLLISYGGAWIAWLLSFMSGSFVSTVVGCALVFNWLFNPYFISSKTNYLFYYSASGKPLYHAIFKAKIVQ